MMVRRQFLSICAVGLLLCLIRSEAAAQSTTMKFTMPTGVDPPTSKYLDHDVIPTTNTELFTGLNLFGRAMTITKDGSGVCTRVLQDVRSITIQFNSPDNVKVTTLVNKDLDYDPWLATVTRNGSLVTVVLSAQPGSASMTSWDADTFGNGFFAALVVTKGKNPANISNVTITPGGHVVNPTQKTSQDIVDSLAPDIAGSVDKPQIWSPNGDPVTVNLTATIVDDQTQSETTFISGVDPCSIQVFLSFTDGGAPSTEEEVFPTIFVHPDESVTLSLTKDLIAKRQGSSLEGRIYTFRIVASDYVGNQAESSVTVTVVHDQSGP